MANLDCTLVHHTGTIIRFTTSQLGQLPVGDEDIQVSLPDGTVVDGHFRCNEENPNISGPGVVTYIKSRLAFAETEAAQIQIPAVGPWKLIL